MNPLKKTAVGAALVASTLVGGAVGASFVGVAGAQDDPSTTTPDATAPTAPADQGTAAPGPRGNTAPGPQGPHQANGITEEVLTGDTAAKVTAAAEASVEGGTVERVETDAEGAAYEAHVTTVDGQHVTVKLDSSFTVTSTEDGMR